MSSSVKRPSVTAVNSKGSVSLTPDHGDADSPRASASWVGHGANGEYVNDVKILPEHLLHGSGGEDIDTWVLFSCEEQRIHRHVAGDAELLGLAQRDKEEVIYGANACDVNAAAVQTGEEEDRREIRALGVGG